MIHSLKRFAICTLLTAASAIPALAQEKKPIEFGYNAVQAGATTADDPRFRVYTNVKANVGPVSVFFQGFNEGSLDDYFGWNTVGVGADALPFDIVYSTHSANVDGNVRMLDEAVGARIDLGRLPLVDYGQVDILQYTGRGLEEYSGMEAVAFVGKEFGPVALEALLQIGENKKNGDPRRYAEIEVLFPPIGDHFREYVRVEFPGFKDVVGVVGAQVQW